MCDCIKSYEEAVDKYGEENLINVCNLLQMMFYADNDVQPLLIKRGLDNKLIAVYLNSETKNVWKEWRRTTRYGYGDSVYGHI
mgnify:CR=1 FL=1